MIGLQFGGSFQSADGLRKHSLDEGLAGSAAAEISVSPGWRFALLYSREYTGVEASSRFRPFDLIVERYMAGIQEEKGESPVLWFGTAWVGATRLVPSAPELDSDTRFALGLELGVKYLFSERVGLRAQARGFYTIVQSNSGALCRNGDCLFLFSGSGFLQGDVSGGLILVF
jgi:hypothetical protein